MNNIYPSSMPYDEITVIDKSKYIEETPVETATIPSGPIMFCPFISSKGYGKDNTLEYMNAARLEKYGAPNLSKFGLSLYLAKQFVSGGGSVLGMRCTSTKSTYANACVYAKIEKKPIIQTASTYDNVSGLIKYHPYWREVGGTNDTFYSQSISISNPFDMSTDAFPNGATLSIADKDYIISNLDGVVSLKLDSIEKYTLVTISPIVVSYNVVNFNGDKASDPVASFDAWESDDDIKLTSNIAAITEGQTYYTQLFTVQSIASGDFANGYKFRITTDNTMNSLINKNGLDAFSYKFSDSDSNGSLDKTMSFSLNSDLIYDDECMGITDVFDAYSKHITMVPSDGLDVFKEVINKICCNSENLIYEPSVNTMDLLFGTNTNANNYVVDTSSADTVNLSLATGIKLSGGSLSHDVTDPIYGGFAWDNDPFAEILADAYNGKLTDLIYNQTRYPFTYIFAPSYNTDVVSAISNLVNNGRDYARVMYIVPKSATYTSARAQKLSKYGGVFTWKETFIPEWAAIKDPYTGKKTFMPSVYFDAYGFPEHWLKKKGAPYAGAKNYSWNNFVNGSVSPSSSFANEYIENHKVGINTMCEDGIGKAFMYEQITAQTDTSALSELNNAFILSEAIRIALKCAEEGRWTTLSDAEIKAYKTKVEESISGELGACYKKLEIITQRESVNGYGRNRILCSIYMSFNDMLKGVSYEFYVLAN